MSFTFGGIFPLALMLMIICGSELFTGNCNVLLPPLWYRKYSFWYVIRNWVIVYFSNLAGCLLYAYFLTWKAKIFDDPALKAGVIAIAEKKCSFEWG